MSKPGSFLLPVWNLTSLSCSSTPISCMTREFRRLANTKLRQKSASLCLPAFSGSFGPNGGFEGTIGEGVVWYWPPTNSFLLLGVVTSVPLLANIDQEMRPWRCGQTDRHAVTEKNWVYNLSHAICYSYGADKNSSYNEDVVKYDKAQEVLNSIAKIKLHSRNIWIRKTACTCSIAGQ